MKTICKGNKQLRVDDTRLDSYLALGYAEIDPETGKPVKGPALDTRETLEAKLEEATAYAENADKANADLIAENKALKAKLAKAAKAEKAEPQPEK